MSITERFKKIRQDAELERKEELVKTAEEKEYKCKLKSAEKSSLDNCELAIHKFGIRDIFKEINENRLNNRGAIHITSGIVDWSETPWGVQHDGDVHHHRDARADLTLNFMANHTPFTLHARVVRNVRNLDNPYCFEFFLHSGEDRQGRKIYHPHNVDTLGSRGFSINTIQGDSYIKKEPNKNTRPTNNEETSSVEIEELCLEKIVEVCEPAVKAGYL